MPNLPEDPQEAPDHRSEEDRKPEERRDQVPGPGDPVGESDRQDPRDDREREGMRVRGRLDPTRYVL